MIYTIIEAFFNLVLFYMAYAVIINKIDKFGWLGIALILTEGLVLLVFKKICPLTVMTRKYSATQDSFDIYLPNWLARNNKPIYSTFFIRVVCGILYRILSK